MRLIFMVGHSWDIDETSLENDLIKTEIDVNDQHFEFKQTLAMLVWLYETCPMVRFVLKTTSNTFINVPKMVQLVDQEFFAANRMYGELLKHMQPKREDSNTTFGHLMSSQDWPWRKYPPFLKGPSMVISGDLIPRMLMAS